ncbi:hypothetical protein CKAN_01591400 [Cinnamomum micranthum f. kanehirae]|uniref:Uncharacterized protein n=1 Tax=Cinnamomum micranthum f. kanehirae TaxID=337451 RepID=A0A443P881_9MAGN|nr:hypothetical protein CKAN_01591400 [Cinnamomum micranthum f. kanehirae]
MMENVHLKLLGSKISGAKTYEMSIGSYRGMIFESSNDVEAALRWLTTVQNKYGSHRRQKGMVVGMSLDGPEEGQFTSITLFVGKYGISMSMEGGLPMAMKRFLQKRDGIFFSGYHLLEKRDRLEKQTEITIPNVLELKQGAVELRALVPGLKGSSCGVVPDIPVDASEEDRAKYYFLAAFQAFMIGKKKMKEIVD